MRNILTVVFTLFFCHANSIADLEKFVINQSRAVSDFELQGMNNTWEIIKIDYPKAKPVFMYCCNNVNFCLFELNKDNKYVIFISPSPQVVEFTVDGVDQPKAIQPCFMKLLPGEAGSDYKLFGGMFELKEEKACELQIVADINGGKCSISLTKKIDTEQKKLMPEVVKGWAWWEGNVIIITSSKE